MAVRHFAVTSDHQEDLEDGRVLLPGQLVTVDGTSDAVKRLEQDGRLRPVSSAEKAKLTKAKTEFVDLSQTPEGEASSDPDEEA